MVDSEAEIGTRFIGGVEFIGGMHPAEFRDEKDAYPPPQEITAWHSTLSSHQVTGTNPTRVYSAHPSERSDSI